MVGRVTSCVVAGNMVAVVAIMAVWRAMRMVARFIHLQGLRLQMERRIIVGIVVSAG